MKQVKILSFAAFGITAMVVLVPSPATATKLCKTTTNPCTSAYPAGSEGKASLRAGSSAIIEVSGITEDTCTQSSVSGKTSNEGSATSTVEGAISTLTFEKCTNTTKVIKGGSGEMHSAGGGAGTPTSKGAEVTVIAFGAISCVAKTGTGTTIGTLDEPASGTSDSLVTVNATIPLSGFLCPSTANFTAEYTVTTPTSPSPYTEPS